MINLSSDQLMAYGVWLSILNSGWQQRSNLHTSLEVVTNDTQLARQGNLRHLRLSDQDTLTQGMHLN